MQCFGASASGRNRGWMRHRLKACSHDAVERRFQMVWALELERAPLAIAMVTIATVQEPSPTAVVVAAAAASCTVRTGVPWDGCLKAKMLETRPVAKKVWSVGLVTKGQCEDVAEAPFSMTIR